GSDELMVDILRKQWSFTGYVTSDCGGIDDFFRFHKTHSNAEAAAVDAVINGTDVECGSNSSISLINAVKTGKIQQTQIDVSVKRLFTIRMRLGMFDPPALVKFAQTPASVLESAPHRAHALKMAQQSIVLLKNDGSVLPLKKTVKKIAVIGPNAANSIAVLGNYNGTPSEIVTALDGIKRKLGNNAEVVYEQAINFTNDTLFRVLYNAGQFSIDGLKGFRAEYYNNRELKGTPVTRMEDLPDHVWQEGENVIGDIKASNFSARYTSVHKAEKNGDITLEVEADDGYRLFINDKLVLNAWERNRWGARRYKLETKKDSLYK